MPGHRLVRIASGHRQALGVKWQHGQGDAKSYRNHKKTCDEDEEMFSHCGQHFRACLAQGLRMNEMVYSQPLVVRQSFHEFAHANYIFMPAMESSFAAS